MLNFKKDTQRGRFSLMVLSDLNDVSKIIHYAAQNYQKMVYISFRQPYHTFLVLCQANKINPGKFFFIDCITRTVVKRPKKEKNAVFISKPTAYEEIKEKVWRSLQEEKYDLLILDSLSDILIYEQEMKTLIFLHSLTATIKGHGCPVIFILHPEDVEKETIKQLSMVVDKTIEL